MKKTIFLVILAILFASSANTAKAAGPICSVPGDYSTIQGAVDDAGCTTINVAAGTYPEHVIINRALTLNGANMGVPGFETRGEESLITGGQFGAIEITSDNVTVDGFKVQNTLNILNTGLFIAPTTTAVTISNNIFAGNQIGVLANSAGTSTVSFNLFDPNGLGGDAGVFSNSSVNLVIDHNEFRNLTTNYTILFNAETLDSHKNPTISFNSFHDNILGMLLLGVTGGNITSNTVVASPSAVGILFGGGDTGITVTDNGIFQGSKGVQVQDAGYDLGDSSNISINRNHIADHLELGVSNLGGYTGNLDATCNWWGASDGPGPVGPGSGDKVSDGVTFAPWLTSAELDSQCGTPEVITHTITSSAGPNGTIDPSGQVLVNEGDSQSFTITANAGFHVADVMVDGGSIGATTTYSFSSVSADHTISASFEANPVITHTISASAGANGTISPSGSVTVNDGATQTFAIVADSGFHIKDVLVNGVSVGAINGYTFNNVVSDHTISATFEANPIVTHTIAATAGSGGSISPSGSVVVNDGADQTFSIAPNSGFHILDVVADGSSVGATSTFTFVNVTGDHTISATFEQNPPVTHTITASAGANGSISPSGSVVVNDGGSQTFAITANTGFHILNVTVDGSSIGATSTYTFSSVTADHTISASFEQNPVIPPPPSTGGPTDKNQCKDSGWKSFSNPGFKNQGDCVSSVASKGKAKGNP